jgi:hypothetical protein
MSRLREFLIAPPAASPTGTPPAPEAGPFTEAPVSDAAPHATSPRWPWRRVPAGSAPAPAIGVLANAADAAVVGAAVGVTLGRGTAAAIVCVHAPGHTTPAPALRAPARGQAARLAASLAARGLSADARGRLVLVALPDDPAQAAAAAERAQAASADLPGVLAISTRHGALDTVLGAQRAILVALPSTAEPTLTELAVAGAAALAPSAALPLRLGPLQRALALAGLRAPRAIRDGTEAVLA